MASSALAPPPPGSYAERARKAKKIRVGHEAADATPHSRPSAPGPPKSAIVNVWNQRMAAARANTANSLPASTGPSATSQTAESTDRDAFVVRANITPARQPPPAIDDESWPEVGKSLQDEYHDAVVPGPSLRKGEKTKCKWVAIPRQELQAAADAVDKQRRKSPRHTQSGSQSRSESLQSSPLFPRGRRLPDDRESSSRPRSPPPRFTTPSTSRPHSPPLVVQPHLAPTPQPIPVYTHNPNPFPVHYPYPASPPPASYFPFPMPLHQPVWYPNLMQHWNPNTSQPGSGQHSPRYPNPNLYHQIPRHDRIAPRTAMTEPHKYDSVPPPPAVSLPVTVAAATTPIHVNGNGGTQQIPTFGSIATARSPSPNPMPDSIQDDPKPFPQFTIGVAPGEILTTRSRSRTHSQTSSHSHLSGKRSRTATGDEKLGLAEVSENGEEGEKVIDLTGGKAASETRWSFGTVATGEGETAPPVDAVLSRASISPPKNAEVVIDPPLTQSSPSELHKRLEQLALKEGEEDGHNPFTVKDYGYGFGSRESSGGSPQPQPQPEPQKQSGNPVWERERGEYAPRHSKREGPSRRGGYNHNHNHNHHSNPNYGHEGRAYAPRRGRGNNHGYGRGGYTHRRNGSGSGYPHQHQQPMHVRPPPPPPFSVTPPFDPIVATGGFYAGRPMIGMGMNGMGMNGMYYDGPGYAPIPMPQPAPVPAPVTPLAFPLDTTRWYLLGQLEYYLSAQNMAQDYFLRQKLDSKGWVPISLIASFKRVRHLTEDEALVREVLTLSSVVEVHGDWVRMKDWEAFVLPDAQPSSVEQSSVEQSGVEQDGDVDEDDEDEDDVVFVLSRD